MLASDLSVEPIVNALRSHIFSEWGKTVCCAGLFTIARMHLGVGLLSVIWSSGVSAIQGFKRILSLLSDCRDFENCPL